MSARMLQHVSPGRGLRTLGTAGLPMARRGFATHLLRDDAFEAFKIDHIESYNHDTRIYRLRVYDMDRFPTAAYVRLSMTKQPELSDLPHRAYTPINLDPSVSKFMELLVKVYPDGVFTSRLGELQAGDPVYVKGPMEKFLWTPNQVQQLFLVAGGTGIAPMLQLIQKILRNPQDKTEINLLFANKTEQDILLREELEHLADSSSGQLRINYALESAPDGWTGLQGRPNEELLRGLIPAAADLESYKICTCGPPEMTRALAGTKGSNPEFFGLLKDLGYAADKVFKF